MLFAFMLSACDPAANIVAPDHATAGVEVSFRADLLPAYAPDQLTNPEYTWDFGDGHTAAGTQATHTYAEPGEYKVVLKVTDDFSRQWNQAYETVTTITIHPPQTSAAINATQGGEVQTPTGAIVEFPAGALSGDTVVQLTHQSPREFALPEGFLPLGEALVISTGGAPLNGSFNVSMPAVPEVPEGKVLAVFEVPSQTSTPMTSAGPAMMAVSTTSMGSRLMSVPSEALKGGKVNLSLSQAGALMLGAIDAQALTGLLAPISTSTKWSGLPGMRDNACSSDADYRPLNQSVSPSYETQLHSRHVTCSEFGETQQPTIVLDKNQNQRYGYVDLNAKWSIHGPSNRLGKRMHLKLSYAYIKALSPSLDEVPVPTLNVRAVLSCSPTSNEHNPTSVNCGTTQEFTLNDGAKDVIKEFDIPINWTESSKKLAEFTFDLKLYYSADGTTPTYEGQVISNQLEYVVLRCDIGQVWGQESGCVFPQASAVLALTDNPQSLAHIREAIAGNASLPGQYTGLHEGTRAIALRHNDPTTGLQRLRVTNLIKANRTKSKALCDALPTPPATNGSCPDFSDPDSVEALTPCDCDEYPFASTREGAAMPRTYGDASVRYISRSDNRSAGARLGAFLRKERLIDPFDHKRLQGRLPPRTPENSWDPSKAWVIDGATLNATIGDDPEGLYSSDFEDRYWIAY
ncbi:MAG: PKD domain-containing protein [Aquabacterium sp.]